VGLTPAGLPVGAQIVGAPYADRTTIAVAAALRASTGGLPLPPLIRGRG
jgi:amidase